MSVTHPAPSVADHPDDALLAGRFAVGRRRSRGPATDVYAGWDHATAQRVAVEFYRDTARPAQRYRREREVAVLAGLDHPALLTVHGRGQDVDGRVYVVTDELDGIGLAERIARGPQPAGRVIDLGIAVAGALASLHAAGLVHRRLTPATIVLDRTTGPVLVDLDGVGTLDVEPVTLEHGVAAADGAFLAPEQISGYPVGPTADVWSLARILEACLAAPRTHAGAPATPATRTPPSLRALLAAMTDPDPERRPGAARVADELAALPHPSPSGRVDARGPLTPPERGRGPLAPDHSRPVSRSTVRRPRRRRGVLVGAVLLGIALEVAALGVATLPPPPSDVPAVVTGR